MHNSIVDGIHVDNLRGLIDNETTLPWAFFISLWGKCVAVAIIVIIN